MRILDKYIIKTMVIYILLAAFIVLGVDALFAIVRELKKVGTGHYTTMIALQYVALTLPRRMYNMFPMASLLGAIMGLGMMAATSELIVMRSGGISFFRITRACLSAAFLLTLCVTVMGEFLVPMSERVGQVLRATARGSGQAMFTSEGAWLKDGSSFIYVQRVMPKGNMEGVVRYDFNKNHQLQSATFAEKAVVKDNRWKLSGLAKSNITNEVVTNERFDSETWKTKVSPMILKVLVADPEDLSMRGLSNYIKYLDDNDLEAESYQLAFWQKALQPFATLVMVFLAVPFIFGPLRNSSMGLRIVSGIMFGFGFYVLNKMFGPLAMVYDFPPLLGALLPTLIFGGVGVWMMRRIF